MQKIKWVVAYPKFGGLPLGFENIFGKPEYIISNGIDENDKHYISNRPDVPVIISEEFKKEDVKIDFTPDLFIALPGCAGLSTVGYNHEEKKSLDYQKNKEIFDLVKLGIQLNSNVVCIESQSGMYYNMGKKIREELTRIQKENNYQIQFYKTNALFHGIPQDRERVFVIFYKGNKCPLFDYFKSPRKKLSEYLKEIPEDAEYQNEYPRVIDNSLIDSLNEFCGTDKIEDVVKRYFPEKFDKIQNITILKIIREIGFAEFLNSQVHINDNMRRKLSLIKHKLDNGKSYWDWQPNITVHDNYIKPVIHRNFFQVHPIEHERNLNVREFLWLMGIPHDYKMYKTKDRYKHFTRNVPVPVQEFIASQIKKYLDGELLISNGYYILQDNVKERIDDILVEENNYLQQLGV